jgi:hypothetical protein
MAVEQSYTLSGDIIVPTLEDLAKVSSTEDFGLQDLIIKPSYYLALRKLDDSKYFTDHAYVEVRNSGLTGAVLYYSIECAQDCHNGWDVCGEKTPVQCIKPREKHILAFSAFLDQTTVIHIIFKFERNYYNLLLLATESSRTEAED